MKGVLLKRKLVRYEVVTTDVEDWDDAVKQLAEFNKSTHLPTEIVEGDGTIEYIGDN